MPFPRGQGLLTHRGNTTVHISQPGSLGSLRLLGTPLQHDCELQVSKRCTEQLFKPYQSEVFFSHFPLKCLSKLILLLHLFSFEMPIYSMTASTRTVPLQMPTESWVWGWRQEPRDDLHFEQGFSDPTFSCWEKERNPLLPAMAECNNPSTAGEQRQNPKLPKEELGSCLRMQLWYHRGHLPPVQTPSPSLSANMTLWHQVCCCEAAKQLIPDSLQLWMCLGLVLPSCATIAFGFRHSPLPLSGQISSEGFCGLRAGHGSQFTVRIGSSYGGPPTPPPHRRWEPAEWRRRQPQAGCGFPYTQYARAHVQYVQPKYTAFCTTDHTFACHYSAYK